VARRYLIAAGFTTLTCLVRLLVPALEQPLILTAALIGLLGSLVGGCAPAQRGARVHLLLRLMPLTVLPGSHTWRFRSPYIRC